MRPWPITSKERVSENDTAPSRRVPLGLFALRPESGTAGTEKKAAAAKNTGSPYSEARTAATPNASSAGRESDDHAAHLPALRVKPPACRNRRHSG
ncbi:MAG: hypothetical protein ACHRXM_33820 [Isosphaerales bacterium]